MATRQQSGDYAYDHILTDDGGVAFKCSLDAQKWRWLGLHPANQIALQAVNYFALSSVSKVLGAMDDTHWSALTHFRWQVFGDRFPSHGAADAPRDREKPDYACTFFDKAGHLVYRVGGAGVVFRNRDFESWRAKAKADAAALPEPSDFRFAAPESVGVASAAEVFVSDLRKSEGGPAVDALVTAQSGFPPAHPFHDGSGDHVNSGHMCDAVQQAARLIRGRGGFARAGEVRFRRYVELGRAFQVTLRGEAAGGGLTFDVSQGQHACATVTFAYDR